MVGTLDTIYSVGEGRTVVLAVDGCSSCYLAFDEFLKEKQEPEDRIVVVVRGNGKGTPSKEGMFSGPLLRSNTAKARAKAALAAHARRKLGGDARDPVEVVECMMGRIECKVKNRVVVPGEPLTDFADWDKAARRVLEKLAQRAEKFCTRFEAIRVLAGAHMSHFAEAVMECCVELEANLLVIASHKQSRGSSQGRSLSSVFNVSPTCPILVLGKKAPLPTETSTSKEVSKKVLHRLRSQPRDVGAKKTLSKTPSFGRALGLGLLVNGGSKDQGQGLRKVPKKVPTKKEKPSQPSAAENAESGEDPDEAAEEAAREAAWAVEELELEPGAEDVLVDEDVGAAEVLEVHSEGDPEALEDEIAVFDYVGDMEGVMLSRSGPLSAGPCMVDDAESEDGEEGEQEKEEEEGMQEDREQEPGGHMDVLEGREDLILRSASVPDRHWLADLLDAEAGTLDCPQTLEPEEGTERGPEATSATLPRMPTPPPSKASAAEDALECPAKKLPKRRSLTAVSSLSPLRSFADKSPLGTADAAGGESGLPELVVRPKTAEGVVFPSPHMKGSKGKARGAPAPLRFLLHSLVGGEEGGRHGGAPRDKGRKSVNLSLNDRPKGAPRTRSAEFPSPGSQPVQDFARSVKEQKSLEREAGPKKPALSRSARSFNERGAKPPVKKLTKQTSFGDRFKGYFVS